MYNIVRFSSVYESPFYSSFLFLLFAFQVISNLILNIIKNLRYKSRSSYPQNLKYKYNMKSLLLESDMLN